jgi:hypothetical protein
MSTAWSTVPMSDPVGGREADVLNRTALAAIAAHSAVTTAKNNRTVALRAALKAGHSTRSLAPLLGVGHMTIQRWAHG